MLTHTLRIMSSVLRGYLRPPAMTCATPKAVVIPFRCLPLDVDPYLHMNNSKYLFLAELARWRLFSASGLSKQVFSEEGLFFILAETQAQYHRPINPFQKFVISTTVKLGNDDKWMYYNHDFLQHPDDVEQGKEPRSFATVKSKAVLKQKNGKTIPPSIVVDKSEYLQIWVRRDGDRN